MTFIDDTENSLERLFKDKPDAIADVPCFNMKNYEGLRERLNGKYDISEPNADDFHMVTVRRRA